MTRRSHAFAAAALIACAVATPLGGRAIGRACAAGMVHVAIVVDPGTGSTVSAVCVPAGARDNGATLLATRAARLGTPPPRYNAAGLLCAIDGFPQSGCGERTSAHYAYWSYFHSQGGTWEYSSSGPASRRVDPGTVEGWRWQPNGTGLPTDPPPRGPASAAAICIPQTTPTTTRPAISGTTAPHPGVTTTPTPAATTPVVGPAVPGTLPAPGTATSTTPSAAMATSRQTTATTTRGGPSTTIADAASGSPPSSIALTAGGIAAPPGAHTSGGAPVGVIVGVLLLIALGAGGAVAARHRRPIS
jgi:hypothetical protein